MTNQPILTDGREARIVHSLVLDMLHHQQPEVRHDLQLLLGGFDFDTFVDRIRDGVVELVPNLADDGRLMVDVTVPTDRGRESMGAVVAEQIGPLITDLARADLAQRARHFAREIGVSDD